LAISAPALFIQTNGILSSSAINLASADVSGILPIANGGTNTNATPTAGGIAYGNGSASLSPRPDLLVKL